MKTRQLSSFCYRSSKEDSAKSVGLWLKKWDIACDAVNFGHQSSDKRDIFEALVAAAQNNCNSHILHVKDDISVSQALSRHCYEAISRWFISLLSSLFSLWKLLKSFWDDHDRIYPAPKIAQAKYSC
ncbi:26S proteasome non-ATPase regulatory subunit 4 [Tanacetum coccineum]